MIDPRSRVSEVACCLGLQHVVQGCGGAGGSDLSQAPTARSATLRRLALAHHGRDCDCLRLYARRGDAKNNAARMPDIKTARIKGVAIATCWKAQLASQAWPVAKPCGHRPYDADRPVWPRVRCYSHRHLHDQAALPAHKRHIQGQILLLADKAIHAIDQPGQRVIDALLAA